MKYSCLKKGFGFPFSCIDNGVNLYRSICCIRSFHRNCVQLQKNKDSRKFERVSEIKKPKEDLYKLVDNVKKGVNQKYVDSHLGHSFNKEHYGKHFHVNDKRLKRGHTEFRMSTGTEQAQNAVRHLIRKVHQVSPHYKVKFVEPQTGKLDQRHLSSVVNNINFHEQGLYMVLSPNNNDFPLIKINKTHEMIKLYSDELAMQRERELLVRGSAAAQKALRQRDKAEKKKSAAKVLNLSWNIGLGDLAKQKKDEIQRRLAKGGRLAIEVGDKRRSRYNFSAEDEENEDASADEETIADDGHSEHDFEMKRREMIVEEICKIAEESNCSLEKYGSIKARIALICIPKVNSLSSKKNDTAEASQRDLKNQRMRAKQKQKQEERISQSKKEENDLDAMYNFKIEG